MAAAWAVLTVWAIPAPCASAPTPPPEITLAEGVELVSLARTAMHRYILRRAGADAQPVPATLKRLLERPYAAAVTLRQDGKPVAHDIRGAESLPRNVMAAALRAMRSPKLPDRVSQAYLDTLTLELEVLGGPRPLVEQDLAKAIIPGHTGLMLTRGHRSSYSLASAALLLGLRPDDMRDLCLTQLGMHREDLSQPMVWAVFASRQYIGYPNGQVKWLQRGKILVPREAIDDALLAAAAQETALYLAATQQADGRYAPAPDQPSGARDGSPDDDLRDHLYATWVLGRVLGSLEGKTHKALEASVNRALSHAAQHVRRAEAAGPAYVATRRPDGELAATALLLLALNQAPPSEQGVQLQKALAARLLGAIGPDGRLTGRLDSGARADSQPAGARLEDGALAWLALQAAIRSGAADAAKADAFRKALLAYARTRGQPGDVEGTLWWARAGLPHVWTQASAPVPAGTERPALRDEIGGFGPPGTGPTTVVTALTALRTASRLAAGPATQSQADLERLRRELLEARRFCYQMMFKRYEAYFAAKPDAWVGAVRAAPDSAAVTLRACAAAIEAFLAK